MIQTLHENKWISLMNMVDPDNGVEGYVYSHESSCNGHKIAVLPVRKNAQTGVTEFLIRNEITPCWAMTPKLSSITGGWEGGEFTEDVIRELDEEAGYTVTEEMLGDLGTCYGVKSADTVYHLYTVDLTGMEGHEATGDGSELEEMAFCIWTSDLSHVEDPLVGMMVMRLALSM